MFLPAQLWSLGKDYLYFFYNKKLSRVVCIQFLKSQVENSERDSQTCHMQRCFTRNKGEKKGEKDKESKEYDKVREGRKKRKERVRKDDKILLLM